MQRINLPPRKLPPENARNLKDFRSNSAVVIDDLSLSQYGINLSDDNSFYLTSINSSEKFNILRLTRTRLHDKMSYHVFSVHEIEFDDVVQAKKIVDKLNGEAKEIIVESKAQIANFNAHPFHKIADIVVYNDISGGRGSALWTIKKAKIVRELYTTTVTVDLELIYSFMNVPVMRSYQFKQNYTQVVHDIPISMIYHVDVNDLTNEFLEFGKAYQVCLNLISKREVNT